MASATVNIHTRFAWWWPIHHVYFALLLAAVRLGLLSGEKALAKATAFASAAISIGVGNKRRESRWWWHWQNLNEKGHGVKGSGMRHGRAWLHFASPGGSGLCLRAEWHLWSGRWGISLDVGGEDDLTLALSCGLFSLYFSAEHLFPSRWRRWDVIEAFCVSWHDGGLWWSFWVPRDSWSSREPKWRRGHFDPTDFFLGKAAYSSRTLAEERADVPMPEGSYTATVKLFESVWKRPRWPWPSRMVRAEVKPDKPIPFPGKGENAWDCDDDACYSLTTPANTVADAISAMTKSVMRSRERYGGRDWKPSVEAA